MTTRIELYEKIFTYLMDAHVIPLDARIAIHSIMYANGYAIDGDKIIKLEPLKIKAGNWYICIKDTCGFTQGELYHSSKDDFLDKTSEISYNVSAVTQCFMLTNKK